MVEKVPARIVWLFVAEDAPIASELKRLAAVLEGQGLIESWSESADRVASADVVMLLVSRAAIRDVAWRSAAMAATQSPRARVVLVRVNTMALPDELDGAPVLPHDGNPIARRHDREAALLDVIQGLQEIVSFRPSRAPAAAVVSPPDRDALTIDDIFPLEGTPAITFVAPPQFAELRTALRTMRGGLLVEGPSKVGKTTAVKKAMESLDVAEHDQIWWSGQRPLPFEVFQRALDELRASPRDTWLFIEDFHHLEEERYRRAVAGCMKILADQTVRHAKITLIGISPLAGSLVEVMPDLSGRFRTKRLDVEKGLAGSRKVADLILLGERAANVELTRRDEFVVAAAGSFFLAQWLCNHAATMAGIDVAQPRTVAIDVRPADVVAAIRDELARRFRPSLLQVARFDEQPRSRGAGLVLLWMLARSDDGHVLLKDARLRFPMLSEPLEWFLASNLTRCLREHPRLKGLLYYDRATTTLTMEDPELGFYLRALDWDELAAASGHESITFHAEDGPVWPPPAQASGNIQLDDVRVEGRATVTAVRRLLHLSDLHLSGKDHATIAYSQLATDLRQQGVERLDALVVSGDLVNRAEATEYDASRWFLERLMSGFGLSARQVSLVPGNHDVSWSMAKSAYAFKRREDHRGALVPGTFIEHGAEVIEVRDEDAYRRRFQPFADLYQQVKGVEYPLDYAAQGTLDDPDGGLLILGLNSAWQIDNTFRDRASIHAEALANALDKLGPPTAAQLRIATFHHPLVSDEDARIKDHGFLQRLAVAGFRLVLHGHVHKEGTSAYHHDQAKDGRRLDVIAAGTFGAATREWVPGYPLEYNLLLVGDDQITVETRGQREVNGAWEPYARWGQGEGKDPLPRYVIER